MSQKLSAIILAGGKGTRMNSDTPKVLHQIRSQPMIFYSLNKLNLLGIDQITVVVGYKAEEVRSKILEKFIPQFALQDQPLGTGHALKCALDQIKHLQVLVINGDDSAFYKIETLKKFIDSHFKSSSKVSLVALKMDQENSLGKVIFNPEGKFLKLMEARECKEQGIDSDTVNCGAYIFDVLWLKSMIDQLPLSSKGEYYITEIFNIAASQNLNVNVFKLESREEWVGVNTQEELDEANKLMGKTLN